MKNKSKPKSSKPQFTESVAMIMELFTDDSASRKSDMRQRLKRTLKIISVVLAVFALFAILLFFIKTVKITHSAAQTQITIEYRDNVINKN